MYQRRSQDVNLRLGGNFMTKELAIKLLARTDVYLTSEGKLMLEVIAKGGTSHGVQTDSKVS